MNTRVSHYRSLLIAILVAATQLVGTADAANAWYRGTVTRVALLNSGDGSFVIRLDSNALDGCLHDYAYFSTNYVGAEGLDQALSMAITSMTTGLTMGVVLDKSENGPAGPCYARSMVADLSVE